MAGTVNNFLNQINRIHLRHIVMVFALLGLSAWAMPNSYANNHKLLIIGDSLSAEYGLSRGTGWVALLENRLS